MFKRLVAAASVSLIALVGVAPAASAAPRTQHQISAIDWDAVATAVSGTVSPLAIDWD